EDCSDNNINEVNAAGAIVPTVKKNSFNSTNAFSAAGPSHDITYSNDEDDVGAEADFNNFETFIPGLRTLIILTKSTKWSRHFMVYIKLPRA
nr:hypothetical protein [Tanacetum cinerariifolium]